MEAEEVSIITTKDLMTISLDPMVIKGTSLTTIEDLSKIRILPPITDLKSLSSLLIPGSSKISLRAKMLTPRQRRG